MSAGVIATVTWKIRPELVDTFIETLRDMFHVTRQHQGFRNIRLLKNDVESNEFILIQEWDTVQNHQDYVQFRIDTGGVAQLSAMTASPPHMSYWTLDPIASAKA